MVPPTNPGSPGPQSHLIAGEDSAWWWPVVVICLGLLGVLAAAYSYGGAGA